MSMSGKSKDRGQLSRHHPVDVLVGKRIRMRRVQKSLSQSELADALGLTFQQVQKYEKGASRVSCSRLFEIAQRLDVPIIYFFCDDGGNIDTRAVQHLDPGDLKDGMRLVAAFGKIGSRAVRQKFLDLLESVAATDTAHG
jgi:transcriptional regulator with XRE-family HTH domain